MRTHHFLAKLVLTLLLIPGGTGWAGDLSFHQAVEQMIQQNPALVQRKLDSEISQKQWNQAKSAYLPQVDFTQSWSYSNNPVYVFGTLLNQERFSESNFAVDMLNHPPALSDHSSRFQLGWLLFDFGKRESRISSAESGHNIASLQEESARLALLQELVKRYYAVSLARQRLVVTAEAVVSAESRLQQARDRVAAGLVVQSDQLVAEVFHARRLQEKIDAENGKKFAVSALYELLGTAEDSMVVTADLKEVTFPDQPLSWWESEMKDRRPELKLAFEGSRMAHSQRRMQQSNLLPSVRAWSNYEWHGQSLQYTGNNWGAGLELHWNLFRGFSDTQQLSAAKLQEQGAIERQRETENAITLQLKDAYYRFRSAKEKLQVAAATVEQAAESKRIYEDRYAGGLVTIQDSLQAETAYNETQLLYSQNLYDLYAAYAALLAAAGNGESIETIGGQ